MSLTLSPSPLSRSFLSLMIWLILLKETLAHVVRVGCHCEIKFWPACSNWQRQDPAEVTHKQTDRHTHTPNQHSLVPVIENDWKKASRWNEVSKCLQGWTLLHDNTCRRGRTMQKWTHTSINSQGACRIGLL